MADSLAPLAPVTLDGRYVTLEPLAERHARDLFDVMQDDEVCRYLAWPPPTALDETLALIRQAEGLMARRESVVFAQIWKATGRAIGSTRLLDVRPADRQVVKPVQSLFQPLHIAIEQVGPTPELLPNR